MRAIRFLSGMLLFVSLCIAPFGAARGAEPPARYYIYASLGDFSADETSGQLDDEGSSYGLVLGFGYRYRPQLSVEVELGWYDRRYDTPPLTPPFLGSIDPRMNLYTTAIAGNAKVTYPSGKTSFYAGAGVGLFFSEIEVTGTIIGLPARRTEEDSNPGFQAMIGADVALGGIHYVGLEYRRVVLEGNFGELSGGEVDIGGDYFAVVYRAAF